MCHEASSRHPKQVNSDILCLATEIVGLKIKSYLLRVAKCPVRAEESHKDSLQNIHSITNFDLVFKKYLLQQIPTSYHFY